MLLGTWPYQRSFILMQFAVPHPPVPVNNPLKQERSPRLIRGLLKLSHLQQKP